MQPLEPRPVTVAIPYTFWRCFVGALVLLLLLVGFQYRHGENSFVRAHDCLDALLPEYSVFAKSDILFAPNSAIFPAEALGGVPRGCLVSEFYLPLWPYRYLSAFHAYVLDEVVARIVALVGMALLLKRVLGEAPPWINVGAAFCFALLPFYPYGLCVAGQPLLLYAVINLAARRRLLSSLLVAAAFPFFSNPVLVGFFLVPAIGCYAIYRWRAERRINPWLVAAVVLLAAGYAGSNYRLFLNWLGGSGYVSHRVEMQAQGGVSLIYALAQGMDNFLYGQYHAASGQFPIILLATCLALAPCLVKTTPQDGFSWRHGLAGLCGERNVSRPLITILWLLLACAVLSLVVGLFAWQFVISLINATGSLFLRCFNFTRVHWLHPLLWGLIFAFSLEEIRRRIRSGTAVVVVLIVLQAIAMSRAERREFAPTVNPDRLTFRQFFSPELFADIKAHIGKPEGSYRVASLGLHPGIALYNGFYTVDFDSSDYPLEYKHRFRKVIAAELAKDENLRNYFDKDGCRCYLFSSELGRDFYCTKNSKKRKVHELEINTDALRDLGAAYVISAVEVGDSRSLDWNLEKVFQRDDSPWQIYLYRIDK